MTAKSKTQQDKKHKKLYSVDFSPMYPVGCCLFILADSIDEATEIAKQTIRHTDNFEVHEENMEKSGVVLYLSGDY